jgi:hypothetical protein
MALGVRRTRQERAAAAAEEALLAAAAAGEGLGGKGSCTRGSPCVARPTSRVCHGGWSAYGGGTWVRRRLLLELAVVILEHLCVELAVVLCVEVRGHRLLERAVVLLEPAVWRFSMWPCLMLLRCGGIFFLSLRSFFLSGWEFFDAALL